jgi:hypothetical protein
VTRTTRGRDRRPLPSTSPEPVPPRLEKCLYFSPVGREGVPRLERIVARFGAANFDYLVAAYDGAPLRGRAFARCEVVRDTGGMFQLARRHLTPDRCRPYGYVFCWADDLELDGFSPARFLDVMHRNRLEIAQPALSARSVYSHALTLRGFHPVGRLTDFVEFMAPVFRRDAWARCWQMLEPDDNFWSWGYDLLARSVCGYRRMGIVDCESITHLRLHSHLYRDASDAMLRLFAKHPRHLRAAKRTLGYLR